MDNIEKHIKANKKEFDVDFPNKHKLWETIEQNITSKKVIPLWQNRFVQFAAAASLIGIIAVFVLKNETQSNTNTICSIQGVSKDFCMQVNNYESDIQQKLSTLNSSDLSIPKEVEDEVILDSPMKVMLLRELKENPNNPKIKDAILKYYKAKLELIQRIEEVLKKQDKLINNETDNSTII